MSEALHNSFEHCPGCGAKLEPEAEQCGSCGRKLFDIGPEDSRGAHFRQGEDAVGDPFELLDEEGSYGDPPPPEFHDLVPVAAGELPEMMALRASLGAQGYETHLSDDQLKVIDPLITGGYVFGSTLLAPQASVAAIRQIVDAAKARRRQEPESEDPLLVKFKRAERNMMLSVLLTPPAGTVIGFYYVALLRKLNPRPRGWGWGIVLWVLCLGVTAFLLFVLVGLSFYS